MRRFRRRVRVNKWHVIDVFIGSEGEIRIDSDPMGRRGTTQAYLSRKAASKLRSVLGDAIIAEAKARHHLKGSPR